MKTFLLGPFAQSTRIAVLIRILIVIILTVFTQVGGILVWPTLGISSDDIGWKYRLRRWLYPMGVYFLGNLILLPLVAPLWSMEALPCNNSSFLQPRSSLTCLMNRHYLKKDAKQSILRVSQRMERIYPRSNLHYLDANFPIPYMHMLPHLNHSKGNALDLSFIWRNPKSKAFTPSPSPIGYLGFSQPETPRACNPQDIYRVYGPLALKLRWDFSFLQPLFPKREIDPIQNKTLISFLSIQPEIQFIVFEPHLHRTLSNKKVVSNSCKVARHDDHMLLLFR
ncbi:MAG: hypothetical protein VX278_16755 [Myxococcota bacterium]|nr:hypothetical protein [Myxococcota bacterium]